MSKRPLCAVALAFVIGIWIGWQAYVPAYLLWSAAFVLCIIYYIYKKQMMILLILFVIIAGSFSMQTAADRMNETFPFEGSQVQIIGTVYERTEEKELITACIKNSVIKYQNQTYQIKHLLVYFKEAESIQIGNTIQIKGIYEKIKKPSNYGQFDSFTYYAGKKIQGTVKKAELVFSDGEINRYREGLYHIKQRFLKGFDEMAGEKESSVLKAMLLGEKSTLDEEMKSLYRNNGISHVLAISGLHISMLGMALYKCLRKLGCSFIAAGLLGMVFMGSYGIMTGFGISTVRAVAMFCVSIGAQMLGRTYDAPLALSCALLILLADNPYYLFQAGFLLSFGAVLGILLLGKKVSEGLPKWLKGKDALGVSISVQLMLLPALAWFYYEIPVYGMFLNLLVIPLMSLVMLSGIAGGVAGLATYSVGKYLLFPACAILRLYEGICRIGEKLPGSMWMTGKPALWKIVLYYTILFIILQDDKILNLKLINKKTMKTKGVVRVTKCILILTLMLLVGKQQVKGLEISMLDVGQGDGLVIQTEDGLSCLIDGGSSDISRLGTYRLLPFLKAKGIEKLDYIIITHADNDHIAGVKELLETQKLQADMLLLPETNLQDEAYMGLQTLAVEAGISVGYISQGDCIRQGNCELSCLHPMQDEMVAERNEYSTVIRLTYGNFSMLFTGDLEGVGEATLIESGLLTDCDILKVAHHGSEYTNSEELLKQTTPEISFISCGENNRYGHPHENLLKRLKAFQSRILCTKDVGMITVKSDGKGYVVKGYRETK